MEPAGSYSYDYPGETVSLPAAGIKDIEVDWVSGHVEIQAGTDQTVTFSESASVERTDEVKMVYKIDDDTLYIRFRRKSINTKISYGKKLQMTVPAALLEDLTLNLVSTDAQVRGLRLEDLEVNVTDGDMDFELACKDAAVSAVDGNMRLNVSGAEDIELSFIGGSALLELPPALGFTLEYSNIGGNLSADSFVLNRDGNTYVSGNGACDIEASMIDSDLTLTAA